VTYQRNNHGGTPETGGAPMPETAVPLPPTDWTTAPIEGPAFYDWVGAAALEEDIAEGLPMEQLVGLSPDRWIIVAMDIHPVRSRNRDEELRLYLADLEQLNLVDVADPRRAVADYAMRHGTVPVHRVSVGHVQVGEVSAQMKRAYVCLRLSLLGDHPLQVMSESGPPAMPEHTRRTPMSYRKKKDHDDPLQEQRS
jgi:hypothetical protein